MVVYLIFAAVFGLLSAAVLYCCLRNFYKINQKLIELDRLACKIIQAVESDKIAVSLMAEDIQALKENREEINDIVDKAARQYQEEISSLFSYCGEK